MKKHFEISILALALLLIFCFNLLPVFVYQFKVCVLYMCLHHGNLTVLNLHFVAQLTELFVTIVLYSGPTFVIYVCLLLDEFNISVNYFFFLNVVIINISV